MTFNLFEDDSSTPRPTAPAESFTTQPTCSPNRWFYRGVIVGCDMKLLGFIGHWKTIEPLGDEIATSDTRVALCKRIDAYIIARGDQ